MPRELDHVSPGRVQRVFALDHRKRFWEAFRQCHQAHRTEPICGHQAEQCTSNPATIAAKRRNA